MKNHQKVQIKQFNKTMKDGSIRHYTIAYIALEDLQNEFGDYYWELVEKHFKEHKTIPQTLCGLTYLHDGDVYDAELGMEVARAKLYKKIFKLKKSIIAKKLQWYLKRELKINNDLAYANRQFDDADEIFKLVRNESCDAKKTLEKIKGIRAIRANKREQD